MRTDPEVADPEVGHTLELDFKANEEREYLAADGPYAISELRLVRIQHGELQEYLLVDKLVALGDTAPYQLSQFQRAPIIIHSGVTAAPADYDTDGLYDVLAVTFHADFLRPGSYTWSGTLQTEDGTRPALASGQSHLGATENALVLSFLGTEIGESGYDGPYYLRDVAIYGQNGDVAVVAEVGTTQAFSAYDFEGSEVSFERLLRRVDQVVITGRGGKPRADGIRTSLQQKARNAHERATAGNPTAAANLLRAFVREVDAQTGKHLTSDDAADLTDLATRIISTL